MKVCSIEINQDYPVFYFTIVQEYVLINEKLEMYSNTVLDAIVKLIKSKVQTIPF